MSAWSYFTRCFTKENDFLVLDGKYHFFCGAIGRNTSQSMIVNAWDSKEKLDNVNNNEPPTHVIKMLIPNKFSGFSSEQAQRCILEEMKIHSRLSHPNIVKALYVGELENDENNTNDEKQDDKKQDEKKIDVAFGAIVMEHGESLDDCKQEVFEDPQKIIKLTTDIGDALLYLSDEGVIHNDLSLGNVIVFGGDVFRITDFGLSLDVQTPRALLFNRGGTRGFIPPENLQNANQTVQILTPSMRSNKSDMFPFGAILYRVIVGKNFLQEYDLQAYKSSSDGLKENLLQDTLRLGNGGISTVFTSLVLCLLALRPEQRMSTESLKAFITLIHLCTSDSSNMELLEDAAGLLRNDLNCVNLDHFKQGIISALERELMEATTSTIAIQGIVCNAMNQLRDRCLQLMCFTTTEMRSVIVYDDNFASQSYANMGLLMRRLGEQWGIQERLAFVIVSPPDTLAHISRRRRLNLLYSNEFEPIPDCLFAAGNTFRLVYFSALKWERALNMQRAERSEVESVGSVDDATISSCGYVLSGSMSDIDMVENDKEVLMNNLKILLLRGKAKSDAVLQVKERLDGLKNLLEEIQAFKETLQPQSRGSIILKHLLSMAKDNDAFDAKFLREVSNSIEMNFYNKYKKECFELDETIGSDADTNEVFQRVTDVLDDAKSNINKDHDMPVGTLMTFVTAISLGELVMEEIKDSKSEDKLDAEGMVEFWLSGVYNETLIAIKTEFEQQQNALDDDHETAAHDDDNSYDDATPRTSPTPPDEQQVKTPEPAVEIADRQHGLNATYDQLIMETTGLTKSSETLELKIRNFRSSSNSTRKRLDISKMQTERKLGEIMEIKTKLAEMDSKVRDLQLKLEKMERVEMPTKVPEDVKSYEWCEIARIAKKLAEANYRLRTIASFMDDVEEIPM
eukprot:m.4070 g.4070  ORF g.4070 m.4070 type:complete len:910 (-) comp2165_c0_seq1:176-2905(-)